MSRQVDLTRPLSEEDRAYLKTWGRYVDIQRNDAQFGAPEYEEDAPDEGPEKFTEEWFEKATVAMLQAELKKRKLPTTGKKDELADRLEEALLEEDDDDSETA